MVFVLNPGDAIKGMFDYGMAESGKQYLHATSSIMPLDESYHCAANRLYTFLCVFTHQE